MTRLVLALMAAMALAACGRGDDAPVPDLPGGALCGRADILGDTVGVVEGNGACGIANAVRVTSVAGVTLSSPALIECSTAVALRDWVDQGVKPAIGREGGGLQSLRVVAHYSCRTRNNRPGARLSEHSYGKAIDIAGFGLNDGSEITVLTDWGNGQRGQILRRIWQAACGPFGTVLGPESDVYHRDHFHMDTASYRSGSYCR